MAPTVVAAAATSLLLAALALLGVVPAAGAAGARGGEQVMEVTDLDGRKGVLSGRVKPGPWVRVDGDSYGHNETGYNCRCNRQSQCQCRTERGRKYKSPADVLQTADFKGDPYRYGLAAKMKKKYVVSLLGAGSEVGARVAVAADSVREWAPALLVDVNRAIQEAQRARKRRARLLFIDCEAQCTPDAAAHPTVEGAAYVCDRCEDNGMGGCGCGGFCCSPGCPC